MQGSKPSILHCMQILYCWATGEAQNSFAFPQILDFPGNSAGKESTRNAGDPSSIPGSGRSTGEGIDYPLQYSWASLVAQLVKNPSAVWETWVQSLGWEDLLQKGKATHSSILAWNTWCLGFPGGSDVKNLPAMQETQVRFLGWEDPLEKRLATHSSIPAWRIPWKKEPGQLQSMGLQRVEQDWATNTFTFFFK